MSTQPVQARQIAAFLGRPLVGPDVAIHTVTSCGEIRPHALAFAKQNTVELDEDVAALYLVRDDRTLPETAACSFIPVANPRLACAKVVAEFFAARSESRIADTAIIGRDVEIGGGVSIGEYSVVGDRVTIGAGTRIAHHVVIADDTIIGRRCAIKSHAVVGEAGFGFDFEPDGRPVRLPHLGRTVIGDDVEIGTGATVCRATFGETRLGDHVKIDDHVHVAHNCQIEAKTVVIAAAVVGGSVRLGQSAWLGPNSTVTQKLSVGDRAFVGIGALVIHDVPDDVVLSGKSGITIPRKQFGNLPNTPIPEKKKGSAAYTGEEGRTG